ncbi:MAG: 3-deoxy-manno-octulosonate cytidylyltransferase [Bacteroidales bacterium]|nr:3-deoxy-manno-octulosonate cytidylyltransferase [Candidatus Physcousia equi]
MKTIGIIPARYASSRLPGKLLMDLGGRTVIERVYRQVEGVFDKLIIATDDERIESAVKAFGAECIMTSASHRSGTDRIKEAYDSFGQDFDVIVNVQGDEPFICPEQIQQIIQCLDDPRADIATLVKAFTPQDGIEALENHNTIKVVFDSRMYAHYFSRSVIPYLKDTKRSEWLTEHTYYKHIGLYAYRTHVLSAIASLPQSPLELAEGLEQLRWIENDFTIKVAETSHNTISIDTVNDLERARLQLAFNQK